MGLWAPEGCRASWEQVFGSWGRSSSETVPQTSSEDGQWCQHDFSRASLGTVIPNSAVMAILCFVALRGSVKEALEHKSTRPLQASVATVQVTLGCGSLTTMFFTLLSATAPLCLA